jgi:hypothetical protein
MSDPIANPETDNSETPDADPNATPVEPAFELPAEPETDDAPWGRKADGTPRKKPGRRADGDQSALHARLDSVGAPPNRPAQNDGIKSTAPLSQPEPVIAVDYDGIGKLAAGMFFGAGEAAFGDDWAPDVKAGEHIQVAKAFSKYFESQEMSDISPGWALVLTLGAYSIKRFHKPTIRERLGAGLVWVKSKFHRGN